MKNRLKKLVALMLTVVLLTSVFPTMTISSAESELSFDGSFAKSSYTMELGETLDVKVNASVTNANLTRVTVNVDGSGVDRLAYEDVSSSDWSGYLTLDSSVYPLNTPGTYTIKLFASADAGDPNWAELDRATLVVTEPEITIDGSFGKSSYTMEVNDTLDIKVKASSENANLTRITVNVDGSGVERHDSEEISGTSWSGYLTLDSSVYPLNTPGTYTIKLFASVDAGDPNWAEVDQATVTVTEVQYDDLVVDIEDPGEVIPGDSLIVRSAVSGGSGDYSYLWTWTHPNGTEMTDSRKNCSILGSVLGTYAFTLTVTDNETGESVTSNKLTVEVKAAEEEYDPMEISFVGGEDEVEIELATVGIAAECIVTGGSGNFEYAWDIERDGATLQSYSYGIGEEGCEWKADKVGVYTFRVTVKDLETGLTESASRSITVVQKEYDPLTLEITSAPTYADVGETVLVAAETTGGVGDVSISWEVYLSNTCVASGNGLTAQFVPMSDGKYTVIVYAEDEAQTLEDRVTITAGSLVKCDLSVSCDSLYVGGEVEAQVTVQDGVGPFSYEWMLYLNDTFVNSDLDSESTTYSWNATQAGTYRIECTVYDIGKEELVGEMVWATGSAEVNAMPNAVISGAFGEDSYTLPTGETLDVAVSASAENASLTRVTVTVDGSGDDSHDSEDVSGSSWNGYLTLDGNVYPLNTPGTYTIKLFAKVDAGNPDWAEVDQATLTVTEAAGCPHTSVEEYWEMTEGYSVTYKSASDTHHTASGHMYKFCTLCLSRVGDNYPVTIDEVHSFDAAGDCTLCDYRVSCQHKETKPKVETSGYTSKGEEGHLFFQYGNLVCANANCSKEVEPYYAEEMQDHTFSDNTCSLCGYSKSEELSVVVARGQSSAETGDIISATATAKGGSGSYKYAWEVICEGVVVDSTDYSMPSSYSYVANDIGSWTFKVYVKDASSGDVVTATTSAITVDMAACPHDLINSIQQGEPQYIKISDTTHEIRTYYNDTCGVCGDVTRADYYKSETAAHAPDANGKCVCGYTAPTATCDHANSIPQQIGQPTVEKYDEKWHEVIYIYKDICANETCQTVLNERREVREMVVHSFDANGKCACGYVLPTEDCDHVATKTELNPKYIPVDASCHHFTVTYHYECECGQVNYNEDAQSFDPHVYEGRICKLCGFENPCDHADFQKVISSVVEDDKNSNSTHFVVTTYAKTCECGAVNPTPIVRTTVPCSFTKSAGVQAEHESQGHQYFDRCECSNAVVNGKFKNYLSSCATCQQQYGDNALAKGTYNSSRVEELQQMLGFTGSAVDGDFGGNTESAVKEFQKKHGLPVTGIVDDATWAKLVAESNKTEISTAPDALPEEKTEQDDQENLDESFEPMPSEHESFVENGNALEYLNQINDLKNTSAYKVASDAVIDDFADGGFDVWVKALYNGLTSEGAVNEVVEFTEDEELALMTDIVREMVNANVVHEDSMSTDILNSTFDIVANVSSYTTALSEPVAQCLYQLGYDPITAANKSAELVGADGVKFTDIDYSKGGNFNVSALTYGLTAISTIMDCCDIYNVSMEQKEALINSVLEYDANMQALDRIIDASTGTLQTAAKQVQKELEDAYIGQFDSIKQDAVTGLLTSGGNTLVNVLDFTAPIRAIYRLTTNQTAQKVDAEFAFIEYSTVLSKIQSDCVSAISTEDEAAYDLLQLYCIGLQRGYDNTYEYYESYGNTWSGKINTDFGNYDSAEILTIITQQKGKVEQLQQNMANEVK